MGALCSGGPAADDAVEVRAQVIAEVTNAYEEKITALEKEIAALKAKLPSAASEKAAGSGVAAVRSRSASSKRAPAQRDDAADVAAAAGQSWTARAFAASLSVEEAVSEALGPFPKDEFAYMKSFDSRPDCP